MNKLFFELIRVAICNQVRLSHTPSADEWGELYAMALKQSLLGICFAGVQKLQAQRQSPPEMLYLQWMGMAAKIQQRNEDMDRKTAEVWALLNKAGLDCAVLKGQGMALLYNLNVDLNLNNDKTTNLSLLRQSGDIDVWVKGGFDLVNAFVQKTRPTNDIAYHRFHYNMYVDTEVELHHRPTLITPLSSLKKSATKQAFFPYTEKAHFTPL